MRSVPTGIGPPALMSQTTTENPAMNPQIGTISHGTMLPEHLIPAFMAELPAVHRLRIDYEQHGYHESEADDILEMLFDELEHIAPEGTYFGAHPGDGSDFGFWPVELLA